MLSKLLGSVIFFFAGVTLLMIHQATLTKRYNLVDNMNEAAKQLPNQFLVAIHYLLAVSSTLLILVSPLPLLFLAIDIALELERPTELILAQPWFVVPAMLIGIGFFWMRTRHPFAYGLGEVIGGIGAIWASIIAPAILGT